MDDDGDDKDDTKRRTRNLSEKKRRDQFNTLVNELSTMVSTNNRKMDKSTVLKATISFLKNHNDITVRSRAHDVHEDWKPAFLSNEEFTYLVLEALEGFLIVFSSTGRVHYVSDSVTSLLGHNPADIVNQSIFDLAHEDDRPHLYGLLQSMDPTQLGRSKENEIRFHCHLKRGTLDFRDKTTYELIQFYGHFRSSTEQGGNEESYKQDINESSLLFVCTGRLSTPHLIRDVSLVDFSRNEFTSRHSLEWKFLFLDHRAPPIIGYLPFEVLGTSGYDYYHFDDLEKVVTCHEALMQKGELTSCYYRFLTKGQQWIWLQSRFYITYHQWSSKPEFVVCTHRVVSYADATNKMKTESGDGEESSHMSEADTCQSLVAPTTSEPVAASSPSGMSESCDAFVQYRRASQSASVKSASASSTSATVDTTATSSSHWARARNHPQPGSDTGSHSGDERYSQRALSHRDREANQGPAHSQYSSARAESDSGDERSSQRNSSREARCYEVKNAIRREHLRAVRRNEVPNPGMYQTHKEDEATLVPQHGIGAQFLNPSPYVSAVSAVGVGSIVPVPVQTVPVIVSPNSAQMQKQLQRKHEELQQMIVRQQAELRQVKEQLLLARLGILPPLINTQYANPEDSQAQQMQHVPAQIVYEPQPPRPVITEYPPPHPPHPHMPQ